MVWFRLQVFDLNDTINRLKKLQGKNHLPSSFSLVEHLDLLERVAVRVYWANTCLYKSVYAYSRLKREGVKLQLHIGVQVQNERSIIAHAWIEDADGTALLHDEPVSNHKYAKLLTL